MTFALRITAFFVVLGIGAIINEPLGGAFFAAGMFAADTWPWRTSEGASE